jgi:hypothetical protein
MRCMERRFIIWKQFPGTAALQPLQYNSNPNIVLQRPSSQQQQQIKTTANSQGGLLSSIGQSLNWMKQRIPALHGAAAAFAAPDQSGAAVGADQQQQQQGSLPRWGDGLKRIWEVFSSRIGTKQYGGVDLRTTDANVSCALNVSFY